MQTSYIYSASRLNILSQFLLTKTDIERLFVANPGEELQSALKETYLAPYVLRVPDGDIARAIELTLTEAKNLISRIAPNGDIFQVLWLQYDIHNLRVFAKARATKQSFADCSAYLSYRGMYDPAYLYSHAEAGTLNRLERSWQTAFTAAVAHAEAGALDRVDPLFDELFFTTATRRIEEKKDSFLEDYYRHVIDLYNLKGRLRQLRYGVGQQGAGFVHGGSFSLPQIETMEQVITAFTKLSAASTFDRAIEYFIETGNTTQIDARADEHLLTIAKRASIDMFSSASLVLYYLLCRQSAANVRTIVVGKESKMSEADIRANLRLAYVSE